MKITASSKTTPSFCIYYVAPDGDDSAEGSQAAPLRHISAAAERAMPGDTIRIRAGVYRERINPPRGGLSDDLRITYEAAPGETVEVVGSERVRGWKPVGKGLWEVEIPDAVFGDFNPFTVQIRGDWYYGMGRPHHTALVRISDRQLHEAVVPEDLQGEFWHAAVGGGVTRLRINCDKSDPEAEPVEVAVRPTVFYPSREGVNFITVRGLTLRHAATNWAPPTAEQIGVIGTNWSCGWIIENCVVTHSRCAGITLGKHGDAYDNKSSDSAEGFVETIHRAEAHGWSREKVGGHVVRNSTIAYCEQAGIVGSLGAIFSRITGNVIHDIHMHRFFMGAEQAGIKFHAPIDTLIAGNHIYRTVRALWMDWMAQGTRITGNLCHDNLDQDLFTEVNHGPYVVDHNVFLSNMSIWTVAQGGAFLHNLFGGGIRMHGSKRETPWHRPHSTEIAGFAAVRAGDDRFINNLFLRPSALKTAEGKLDINCDKHMEAEKPYPNIASGNRLLTRVPELEERTDGFHLDLGEIGGSFEAVQPPSTESLGNALVPDLPYEDFDGSPLRLEEDYFGRKRTGGEDWVPGPFAKSSLEAGDLLRAVNRQSQGAPVTIAGSAAPGELGG